MSAEAAARAREAEEILADAGIDPDAALKRLMARVGETERDLRSATYRRAAFERERQSEQLRSGRQPRSRVELLEALQRFKGQAAEAQAMYKNLESIPDDDLASLVAELEFLAEQDDEKT